jgi:membrane protein DedA with SNARE-associated domain
MNMFRWIIDAFEQHGYVVLFVSLLLELLALPLPGELLMGSAGLLVFQGKLSWPGIILTGGLGVCIGMTTSYFIGYRLGMPFVRKYGKYVHFGPEKLEKTSEWFATYGNKLLIAAYFIPGVRHFTGYFSGVTRAPFRRFAAYAYTGAFLWVGTFVTIGKLLGPQWEKFHSVVSKYLLIGGALFALGFICIYMARKYRGEIARKLVKLLDQSVHMFHSLGRVKFLVALTALFFLAFTLLTIGLIQDYMANEFDQFNLVVTAILASLQEEYSFRWAEPAAIFTSLPASVVITVLILLWIVARGRDKPLEIAFLAITIPGGELWGELLTNVFHRIGSPSSASHAVWGDIGFPSEPTLMAVVIYGYSAFVLFRHSQRLWLKSAILPALIGILLWVGVNDLVTVQQLPSSIVAGFSFGGVWVTLQIILLEVFRMLRSPVQAKNS